MTARDTFGADARPIRFNVTLNKASFTATRPIEHFQKYIEDFQPEQRKEQQRAAFVRAVTDIATYVLMDMLNLPDTLEHRDQIECEMVVKLGKRIERTESDPESRLGSEGIPESIQLVLNHYLSDGS